MDWQKRVQRVLLEFLSRIARMSNVDGHAVSCAKDMESQTYRTNGLGDSEGNVDSETLDIILKAREHADEAIREYLVALHGSCIPTDWVVVAEIATADDNRNIAMASSPYLTPWKWRGMMHMADKYVQAVTE